MPRYLKVLGLKSNQTLDDTSLFPFSLRILLSAQSLMPIPIYKDYISPQDPANSKWLARTLGSIRFSLRVAAWLRDRDFGEHRLTSVAIDTFDAWAAAHPDYPHPIQLDNKLLIVTVVCPPHDGAAGAIIQHIRDQAFLKCAPADCKLSARTGRTFQNLLHF